MSIDLLIKSIGKSLITLSVVVLPIAVSADARVDVAACRAITNPKARLACFDATSARLLSAISAEQHDVAQFGTERRNSANAVNTTPARNGGRVRINTVRSALIRVYYDHGRPRFFLQNGQVWRSKDKRQLTLIGGGTDSVRIDKTPVGFLLHFNGSFFGLTVVRAQ